MTLCRNLLHGSAFLLGLACLLQLALVTLAALSESGSTTLLLLAPLLIGLTLALISARSICARQWQKGPAMLLAAATFARLSLAPGNQIDQLQHQADSWFDVALGLAVHLLWICLIWLLSAVVYQSSDRIFAAIGRALARHLRFKAPGKAHRS